MAVITTAGTLVAVLVSLAALVRADEEVQPPAAAVGFLLFALVLFVAAAGTAIATNVVRTYELPDIDHLSRLLDERYRAAPESTGEHRAAEVRIKMLQTVRSQNARKAAALQSALLLEVSAVTFVAISIGATAIWG
ncbi:MAG: hypothetical protein M3285_00970 [Actinomycetota bacterium]|nr:hypothetical protein [Actinomycetota bacterium]